VTADAAAAGMAVSPGSPHPYDADTAMRISDADRSRAVDELRRHSVAGRLDIDAYAARLAEAMEAETLADLDHALRDLPTMRIADPSSNPPLLARGRNGRGGRASAESRPGPAGRSSPSSRLWSRLVVLLSMLVLVVGISFGILAHWVWAGVLIVGWVVGVLQGRVRVGRRR
jgi:hypothetical protein